MQRSNLKQCAQIYFYKVNIGDIVLFLFFCFVLFYFCFKDDEEEEEEESMQCVTCIRTN